MRKRYICLFSSLAALILIIGMAFYIYQVPRHISKTDIYYIEKINSDSGLSLEKLIYSDDFEVQIQNILAIQKSAFDTAPENGLIPAGTPREPENLYYSKTAHCFDRARYIDKALRYLGYEARYVGIYEDEDGYSMLETMLTPSSTTRVKSHAAVEVKTAKGWLIVDTRKHWISLTKNGEPVSLKTLQKNGYSAYEWSDFSKDEAWPLMQQKFHVVYGLYSRHGQFYPPYTKYIPDINWYEFFLYNLSE